MFSISANGDSATLTALQEGNGIIEVSHPLSKNTLTLNVRVGNEFIYKNTDVAYISSQDIVRLRTDSEEFMLSCILAHTESSLTETQGFHFSSSDSEYSEFAFSADSKSLLEKSIFFIPMQVPLTVEKSWIEYESSDNEICVVTGSDKVCMIAGISKGSATVTAMLRTAGGIAATVQMAVIVGKAEEAVNTVSCGTTIINMEIGESKTLEALLSGAGISPVDSYDISWISSDSKTVSVLQNGEGKSLGKNAYITAKRAGIAVITVSHPKCLYDLSIWVVAPEREEAMITLDQTYIEMNKSDGAVSVTAKLSNAKDGDENGITWTAPKVGGVNIITVSKSKGKTCNIVPRNTGSTILRAQLPKETMPTALLLFFLTRRLFSKRRPSTLIPVFPKRFAIRLLPILPQ